MRLLPLLLLLSAGLQAQWQLQQSNTSADLRGIHAIGNGVAWASGSNGTVLRTTDGGKTWLPCTVPPDAEKLDFRGVQAFDASTAIVMSSGKGDLSRLYKTRDGCKTWKLLFTNPDKEGFWDTVQALATDKFEIAGDSVDHTLVNGKIGHVLPVWEFQEGGDPGNPSTEHFFELAATPKEGGFAASNSTLAIGARSRVDRRWSYQWLATGDAGHSYIHRQATEETQCEPCRSQHVRVETSMSQGSTSAGIFSLGFRGDRIGVAVGGDYQRPDQTVKTAVSSNDWGGTWVLATTPPHGYRSSVAYDPTHTLWITVGPNGTDVSADDGRNWRALRPGPGDDRDADQHWNALSLPFVVGPKGRIGVLRPEALATSR